MNEGPAPRWRRVTPPIMVVIGAVATVLAVVSVWVNRQFLNPTNWSKTSTQLLQSPAVRDATANYLVEQVYEHVNVQGEVSTALTELDNALGLSKTTKKVVPSQLLPDQSLSTLSGPIAGALRGAAEDGVKQALQTSIVQDLWAQANKLAAESLVTVIEGGKGPVRVNNGAVTINLNRIVNQASRQLGLGVHVTLPAGVGRLTVFRSNDLRTVQWVGRDLRKLPPVLIPLAILLYVAALAIASRGRRRRMLIAVGFSLVIAGLVALLIRSIMIAAIPGRLAQDAAVQPAVHDVVALATSMIVELATAAWELGVLIVIGAWLAGPSRLVTPVRRWLSPWVNREAWALYTIAGVILLILFLWHPLAITREPLGMLMLLVLAAIGTELLRRQMLAEFPDATTGTLPLAAAAGAVGRWAKGLRRPSLPIQVVRRPNGREAEQKPTTSAEETTREQPTAEAPTADDMTRKPAPPAEETTQEQSTAEAPASEGPGAGEPPVEKPPGEEPPTEGG